MSDPRASLFDVEFELASYERAVAAQEPWPAPCVLPPLPVPDPGALVDLQNGDREADFVEAQAAGAARSRGALDLAVGDGLAAMQRGERLIRLGYSCLGDYAREVLGIPERRLMNAVLELARSRGLDQVTLDTWWFNTNARAFFARFGFREQMVRFARGDPGSEGARSRQP